MNNNLILNMNRSPSVENTHSQSKSPSRRAIYINEEISNKREKHTTFHSPYKDGRPNKDYVNPSFLSSNLFYPKDYTNNQNIAVQPNYVRNSNDIKKETLYRQRMKTEADNRQRSKTKEKQPSARKREFKQDKSNNTTTKIIRINEPQKLLSNQLECLQNYRENLENRNKEKRNQQKVAEELPPYFIRQRRDADYDLKHEMYNRTEMGSWMAVTSELNEMKKELKKANQAIEHDRTCKLIQQNQSLQAQQQNRRRQEADLLGSILREQMRTNQLRKQRRRNH